MVTKFPVINVPASVASDARIASLLERGHYDAFTLLICLMAHSKAVGYEGHFLSADVRVASRACHIRDARRVLRVLIASQLVTSLGHGAYTFPDYPQWNSASEQAKRNADRMRTARTRGNTDSLAHADALSSRERASATPNMRNAHASALEEPDEAATRNGNGRVVPDSIRLDEADIARGLAEIRKLRERAGERDLEAF